MAVQQYPIGQYLDKAVNVLSKFGIVSPKDEGTDISDLLEELMPVAQDKVTAIARVVDYISTFNGVIRAEVADVRVGDRYAGISGKFDSIQKDAKDLVAQVEDGKIDVKERLGNLVMRLTRGSIPTRFVRIKQDFLDVQRDTKGNLVREEAILAAYADFRVALGESRAFAYEVRDAQKAILDGAQQALQQAQQAVGAHSGSDDAAKARLETARAEALRAYNLEDRRYQLALDVAVHLQTSFNVGETIMAKLQQTHDLKQQVYGRSVIFFSTNEHVFTALAAGFAAVLGLNESSQSLKAMAQGTNDSLETLAQIGTKIETEARQVGYGALIRPESVKALVDAIVQYQEETIRDVAKLREESEQGSKQIEIIVEEGKERVSKALAGFQEPPRGALPAPTAS